MSQQKGTVLEVYGFIQLDAGYNAKAIDPDWFDVMRPSKLPSYSGEFGPAGFHLL
jgi:hypothetical protein